MRKNIARFIKNGGVEFLISAIVLLCALFFFWKFKIEDSAIDWTIFTSIVIAVVLSGLSRLVTSYAMNYVEDSNKLTDNPKWLVQQYSGARESLVQSPEAQGNVLYPVLQEVFYPGARILIQDSQDRYTLPEFIENNFDELFSAHATSNIYNQLNIRVDKWNSVGNEFVIETSRTTYFDSLVTNRVMDYQLPSGLTVRSKLEPGPFITPLNESCFSNHLGFNGHVESSDGWLVMVKRGNKLSIGKNTYGNSVGASLKTKYALNPEMEFTGAGLENAIKAEIFDELKISEDSYDFELNKNIIAVYRDLLEGGKPQLLFYVKSNKTRLEIENNFRDYLSKRSKKGSSLLEDGEKLTWIRRDSLPRVSYSEKFITADVLVEGKMKRKKLKMVPSALGALVMLQQYLYASYD